MLSLEKKKRLDTEHLVLFKLVFHQSSSSFSTHTYFCLESLRQQGTDTGQTKSQMLELLPWVPAGCDPRVRARIGGAAEPGQYRR